MESVEKIQLDLLKERIEYNEQVFKNKENYEKCLERLLEDSKYIALSLRYPYEDYSLLGLPKKYYNWQLRCCEQLYSLIGSDNIVSYSENGLSWTKDSSYLNKGLTNEIMPKVGVPKDDEQEN